MTQQRSPNRPDHQKQAASDRMREMATNTEDKLKDAQELASTIAEQARVMERRRRKPRVSSSLSSRSR
jgi:hypothetical protein